MDNFTRLSLDQDKIINAIKSFERSEYLGLNGKNHRFKVDNKQAIIQVHLNTDGSTSLVWKVGSEHDLSKQMAEHIVSSCIIDVAKKVSYGTDNLSSDDLQLILLYLKEEGIQVFEKKVSYGIQYEAVSKCNDRFYITRYTTNKTLFQGRPLKVYSILYSILYDLGTFNTEDIIKLSSAVYEVDICRKNIEDELKFYLPTAHSYLCEPSKKLVMSSLVLLKISVDIGEYTCYVFGVLKALEAFLKRKLKEVFKQSEYTDLGYFFSKDGKLHERFSNSKNVQIVEACNGLYSFYVANRHKFFHANGVPQTMALIEDYREAERIITTTLKMIEEGHNEII